MTKPVCTLRAGRAVMAVADMESILLCDARCRPTALTLADERSSGGGSETTQTPCRASAAAAPGWRIIRYAAEIARKQRDDRVPWRSACPITTLNARSVNKPGT